jgi:hypothetical protein
MNTAFAKNWVAQACLMMSMSLSFGSVSCQKKGPPAASPPEPQPQDHFVGTWKLNKEKSQAFSRYPYNPMPVYEWMAISEANDRFMMTFSHLPDKPWELERVFLINKETRIGIDAVNGKLMVYNTYAHRVDADHFTQGNTISESDYEVLPDQKTMTVRQLPMTDNGGERRLVYDKVPASASGYGLGPRF